VLLHIWCFKEEKGAFHREKKWVSPRYRGPTVIANMVWFQHVFCSATNLMDFKREIVGNGGHTKGFTVHNHHNQDIVGFYQQQSGITSTHMGRHRFNWQIN